LKEPNASVPDRNWLALAEESSGSGIKDERTKREAFS
jgi:hypothetical protein